MDGASLVIIGSIGALVIWWIRRSLQESPRWLAQHGQLSRKLNKIVGDPGAEISAPTNGGKLPPPEVVSGEAEA